MEVPEHLGVVDRTGAVVDWTLRHELIGHRHHRLVLTDPSGATWVGDAGDLFECLMELRQLVEPAGFRFCCNGARIDAWPSGLLRDMGSGVKTYLLDGVPRGVRPPQVPTLEYAPPDSVVTAEDQTAWHQQWVASRGA